MSILEDNPTPPIGGTSSSRLRRRWHPRLGVAPVLLLSACLIVAISFGLPWQINSQVDLTSGQSTTLLTMYVWTLGCPFYVLALPLVLLIAATLPALRNPPRTIPLKNVVFAALLGLVFTVSYAIGQDLAIGVLSMGYCCRMGRTGHPIERRIDLSIGAYMSFGAYVAVLLLTIVFGIQRWRTSIRR